MKIVDDVPTAANDTDTVANATATATGNVMTGTDTTSGVAGADVKGADGATVTTVISSNVPGNTPSVNAGVITIAGEHGTLVMQPDGSYVYTRTTTGPLQATETFTYTLTDGDQDTSTATLTLTIGDNGVTIDNLTPEAGGGDVTVYESALDIGGSNPSSTAETGSGTFTIAAPDGVNNVTIGGTLVISSGSLVVNPTFTTALGNTFTVTGYNAATGEISYSYTLGDNEAHAAAAGNNNLFEDLAVVVTDVDNDSANATLSVKIVDDVPTAANDTDTVANATATATGNVMTGTDTSSGAAGADVQGADGATVTTVFSSNVPGNTPSVNAGVITIVGQYGTLVMQPDGSYVYTRATTGPLQATETFTYTLTDGDQDTSTATLTLTIGDNGVTIDNLTPEAGGGDVTVEEAALSDGSNPSSANETGTGSFTIAAPDGVNNVTIGGTLVISNGILVAVPSFTTALGNTFTVTGYNAATGEISYSYTLGDNEAHAAAAGNNDLFEDLAVVVTDIDGDSANATLAVRIVDDVPTAGNDTDTISNATATATGNVMTGTDTSSGVAGADVQGADGATVTTVTSANVPGNTPSVNAGVITIAGEHGTLVMQPDGSYVYTRTTTGPLQATETFTYTLTDGDQDTSTATLTLTIGDNGVTIDNLTPEAGGGDVTVEEAALSDGSNPSSTAETGTGSFTIAAPDGVNNVTIGGTLVISNGSLVVSPTFTTALGNTFTVTGYNAATGEISYSYTLGDNEAHAAAAGNNNLFEDLAVVVTDVDNDSANATLSVKIVDDVPTAANDTDTISNATATATGNVMTGTDTSSGAAGADVQGADGATVTTVTSANVPGNTPSVNAGVITIVGQYGTLVMQPDGSYVYTRATTGPLQATETFTYTLTDGDQDTSTATLTLTIGDNGVTIDNLTPQAGGGDVTVEEAALSDGSNPASTNETGTGSFTIAAPDGVNNVTIGGTLVISNGILVAVPSFTTALGNTFTVTGYNAATGEISYSYTLGDNEAHAAAAGNNDLFEDLAVVVTDIDGDSANATLSVKIVDDVPTAANDTDTVANATATATGNVMTGTDTSSGAAGADVQGADGATVTTVFSSNVPGNTPSVNAGVITIVGQYGTLVMQPDGSYVYTRATTGPLQATETFTYTLTDGDQDTSTANLTLTIGDNGVTIDNLTPEGGGGDVTVYESALNDGSNPPSLGETGTGSFTIAAPDGVNNVTIGGTLVISNGSLVAVPSFTTALGNTFTVTGYNAATGEISYSYTLLDNEAHAAGAGSNDLFENLAVTVTDTDGDPANATLSVRIVDDVPTASNDTDKIDNATATATGNVITGANTTSGAAGADVQGADGATVSTVTSTNVPGNTPSVNAGVITIVGQYGTLVMQPNGSYVYTRASNGTLQATETFTYTLRDGDQDTSTATLTLTIGDNGVTIDNLTPEGGGGDVTVYESALDIGGSNPSSTAETGSGTFTIAAPDGVNNVTIGGTLVISNGSLVAVPSFTTALGNTFTVTGYNSATGVVSYTYTLNDNEAHPNGAGINNLFENLGVSVTDVDGDAASGTLAVKIVDDIPTLGAFNPGTLPNAVGSVSGTFGLTPGADGIERFFINGPTLTGISYSQSVAPDGTTTLLAQTTAGTPVFTLVVKPDGTYEFNLLDPKPEQAVTQPLTGLTSGGPEPWLETPDGLIEFTGNSSGVNASTQGFGIDNQFVNPGENFTMEFHTVGSPGDTPAASNAQYVGKLDFTVNNGSGTVSWTVTNSATGQTESGTATVINGQLLIDPTIDFNIASITGTSGSMRLQAVSVGKIILPPDYGFEFSITAQDQDGDITSAQTLDISVTTQVTSSAATTMAAFAMPVSTDHSGFTPESVSFADQGSKEPPTTDGPTPDTSGASSPTDPLTEAKPEENTTSSSQPESRETEHVSLLDDGTVPVPVPTAPADEPGSGGDTHSNAGAGNTPASPPLPEHILVSNHGDSIEGLLPPAAPATPPGPPTPQNGEPGNVPPMMPDHAPVPPEAEELARAMLEQGQHNNPSHL
ncbi:VCBS domain-containing protein [bacterium BD-1]|nr:VCBS domain-containing protein [Ottowia caeni]